MKKVYCVYCGTSNKSSDTVCSKCQKKLNPKESLFKDYLIDHIKDDLKGNVKDNIFSLITNFIKSHLYGTIMSVALISAAASGVVSLKSDEVALKKVESKPDIKIEVEDLDINSPLVYKLWMYVRINNARYVDPGFYENKLVRYDDIAEKDKFLLTWMSDGYEEQEKEVTTCEDLRGFNDIYKACVEDPDYILVGNIFWSVNTESFLTKYQSIYGSDKNFARKKYWVIAKNCEFNANDEMLCYTLPEGWMELDYEYTKIEAAKKYINSIVIYDRVLFLDYSSEKIGTYRDSELKEKLSDNIDDSLIMEGSLYKHTYRLDKNGNYYWYSSEPVEEIL